MFVRLKSIRKVDPQTYRVALEVGEPGNPNWEFGDFVVRVDVQDVPVHQLLPRGVLGQAFTLYTLARDTVPLSPEARLLWDLAKLVNTYVDRLFTSGLFCGLDDGLSQESRGPID